VSTAIRKVLQLHGATVMQAATAREAEEIIAIRRTFDFVILDRFLEERDCLDHMLEIIRSEMGESPAVIVLTGSDSAKLAKEFTDREPDAILSKTCSTSELLERLTTALVRRVNADKAQSAESSQSKSTISDCGLLSPADLEPCFVEFRNLVFQAVTKSDSGDAKGAQRTIHRVLGLLQLLDAPPFAYALLEKIEADSQRPLSMNCGDLKRLDGILRSLCSRAGARIDP
jgi:CheY-like chemotaxis protein